MRRYYISRKPTRREVQAALKLYEPYNDGSFIDIMQTFAPGTCWSIIPGSKISNTQDRQCANKDHINHVSVTRPNSAITADMWLCATHRKMMERKGYVITPVIVT
jgi:hypothetical protein